MEEELGRAREQILQLQEKITIYSSNIERLEQELENALTENM